MADIRPIGPLEERLYHVWCCASATPDKNQLLIYEVVIGGTARSPDNDDSPARLILLIDQFTTLGGQDNLLEVICQSRQPERVAGRTTATVEDTLEVPWRRLSVAANLCTVGAAGGSIG